MVSGCFFFFLWDWRPFFLTNSLCKGLFLWRPKGGCFENLVPRCGREEDERGMRREHAWKRGERAGGVWATGCNQSIPPEGRRQREPSHCWDYNTIIRLPESTEKALGESIHFTKATYHVSNRPVSHQPH